MSLCRRIALGLCPDLAAEVAALQDGNTKCVRREADLLDRAKDLFDRGLMPADVYRRLIGSTP